MNGGGETAAEAEAAFGSSSTNGRDAPEARRGQSEGEAPGGSDQVYFPRSWARHPKKRQRTAWRASGVDEHADASRYQVEHLSTLVLERKAGLLTAEDGVRRLRLLDAKGKIWTQDMLLRVRRHDVSLLDADTQCELEVFPLSSLQQCQAVTNACGFDSILALVCKDSGQRKADLHLFQCDHVKAHLIRADIRSALTDAKGGGPERRPDVLKMIRNSQGEIPPPPAAPAPEPPTGPEDGESRGGEWRASPEGTRAPTASRFTAAPWHAGGRRTTSEDGTAAAVDGDVRILNRLLDDIEAFVGQLQKAAEACGQLARRKRNKKAAKKRTPGEGVLTLRSRAPSRRRFLDCLQKFKFAFNQLGKLNGRIRNPGADELLHFLFVPLRMVVQASGGADVARGVTVPLLTRDAVELLRAAGTAEERRLWAALGDGWTKCRSEWPKDRDFPPCPPAFADSREPPARRGHSVEESEAGREAGAPSAEGASPRPLAARGPVLEEDAASERAAGHRAKLTRRFAKSKYDFVARNNTELSVLKDELVEVLDDRKQWWKVRNGDGSLGYVPNNILDAAAPAVDMTGRGEAVYSHTIQKQTGARTETLSGKDVLSPAPPAPPPLPPPPSSAVEAARTGAASSASRRDGAASAADRDDGGAGTFAARRRSTVEEVRDELLQRLTLGRSAREPPGAGWRRGAAANAPGVSVTYESTPDEVRRWLEAKAFGPVTVGSLGVLTGAQLFSLNKDELKTVCPDDGARVFSQLTVQKAALERRSGSELREVMRRRREILAAGESGTEP